MGISTCEQADDSERLILEYFNAIRDSPSHLYHSALPLSPSSSWVRRCYRAEVAGEVRVLMGLSDQWDACSRTIFLQGKPSVFACWGDIIAVGLGLNVELLDAITGVSMSVLRGHEATISSIAFSPDGTLLVSTSKDDTVRLWDIQTGGLIRTFSDYPSLISAISISPDCTAIAFGTYVGPIHLWDVQTGERRPITHWFNDMRVISFSPVNSRRLISLSRSGAIQQWNVDGHQVGASYREDYDAVDLAYSSDGTRFISCGEQGATVRDSESGAVVANLCGQSLSRCCFSPDGRFVACSGDTTIYVWDITIPGARLVRSLVEHSEPITFLAFSSSLVSGSLDQSVKFWQSSSFLAESTTADHAVALSMHNLTPIRSVNLFAEHSTVVTSDKSGVVRTWDIMTGTCKSSFSTPAKGPHDTHLGGDTLTIVWYASNNNQNRYHIWDAYKGRLLRTFNASSDHAVRLKISGDGSKIFVLFHHYIEAVSMQTGERAGYAWLGAMDPHNFFVHGSKVGIDHSRGWGWDFRGPEVSGFGEFPDRPRLDLVDRFIGDTLVEPRWIKDTVTKTLVFRFPDKYIKPGTKVEWDGRYLLVWSESGEVAIMDFNPVQCALDRNR